MSTPRNSIVQDTQLRTIALAFARNKLGANVAVEQLLPALGIEEDEYEILAENPQFERYVEAYTAELQENGFSFAAKARILAEDLLPDAYKMAKDREISPAVRAKMIENLVEWGDLKPKNNTNLAAPGAGFSITINLPGGQQHVLKDVNTVENDEKPAKKAKKSPKTLENKPEKALEIPVLDDVVVPKIAQIDTEAVKNKLSELFDEGDDYVYAGDDVHE
jgi:hypothetical protein